MKGEKKAKYRYLYLVNESSFFIDDVRILCMNMLLLFNNFNSFKTAKK